MRNITKFTITAVFSVILACASIVQGATWGTLSSNSTSGTWSPLCIASGTSQTWRAVTPCSGSDLSITLSANQSNFNVATYAKTIGWDGVSAVSIQVTVNSGVTISSSSTSSPSFTTGALPTGSSVSLINNGTIVGRGGNGGAGTSGVGAGSAGLAGGTAINLTVPTSIENAGFIYGGGGGGGGGGGYQVRTAIKTGGGGGGGIGLSSGGSSSHPGTAGTLTAYGTGGAADSTYSGAGGNGGSYGAAGSAGGASSGASGGAGGAAGKAILKNSNTLTWISGNDTTHVKGVVQ